MSKYRAVVKAVKTELEAWQKEEGFIAANIKGSKFHLKQDTGKGLTVFLLGNTDPKNIPEAVIRIEDETNLGGGIVYHSEIAYEGGPQFFFGVPDFHKLTSRGTMDEDVNPNKAKRLTREIISELDSLIEPDDLNPRYGDSAEYRDFVASIKSRRQESLRRNPAASSVGGLFVAGLLGYAIAKRSR